MNCKMKRLYIPFLLMAAAAVAACESKVAIDEPAPADGSYIYTLTASVPEVDTKSDYSSSGKFSSVRTIREYASQIWNTGSCPVPLNPDIDTSLEDARRH